MVHVVTTEPLYHKDENGEELQQLRDNVKSFGGLGEEKLNVLLRNELKRQKSWRSTTAQGSISPPFLEQLLRQYIFDALFWSTQSNK